MLAEIEAEASFRVCLYPNANGGSANMAQQRLLEMLAPFGELLTIMACSAPTTADGQPQQHDAAAEVSIIF